VRARVWALLEAREAGFPWISILGKQLPGWVVIDMDATIITAASNKEGAAGTFKKTFGHQCAMRRFDVSPVQPGGTWKEVPGPDG
jgi:hypothetical protein